MNLMKLFNFNYLKQNLKKSKVILSIFIGLIPILNTIILILNFNNNSNYVLGFSWISIINFIGIYVLPVIVSICLFNYIYKKNSVDFINSMPISRKSIFVTNTLFGILIFLMMLIVNLLLMGVFSIIFSIHIPFAMMIDYLLFWWVVYIFIFSATNLTMTISGNAITQIVVTLLLVFLIPFSHMFINVLSEFNTNNEIYLECSNSECIPQNYYCYDDLECNINKLSNRYEVNLSKEMENNYTSPFGFIYGILIGENKVINSIGIIKMILLSIIYIILGYFLFIRRKMEVSETSFKNIHIHNIVKSLTLVPIVAFFYLICRDGSLISLLFVLIIILIYCFVYDLITKKNISNIRLSLMYSIFSICLFTIIFSLVELSSNRVEKVVLNYSDIKSVAVDISIHSSGYYNSNMDNIYIENEELTNLIIKNIFNEYNDLYNYHLEVYLKTNNNTEYSTLIHLTKDDYDKVINIISENEKYLKYYKDINLDKVYAVKIGNSVYDEKDASAILKLVSETLNNLSLKELFDLQKKYNNVSDDFYISLYTYENHDSQEYRINGYINYDILNSIVNSNNKYLKENIEKFEIDDYYIHYSDKYTVEDFEIDHYVLRNAKDEIYNFILKELNNSVDMKKEFVTFRLSFTNQEYLFTTNNIVEFRKILDDKYEEVKDTSEYLNYYGYDKIDYEYFDKVEEKFNDN